MLRGAGYDEMRNVKSCPGEATLIQSSLIETLLQMSLPFSFTQPKAKIDVSEAHGVPGVYSLLAFHT